MWNLWVLEAWLTNQLLRSPTFHRGVRAIHKKVHEIQHGKNPAEMGGTHIDDPNKKKFIEYYIEELKEQFRGNMKR